ncbi:MULTISPECIES: RNA 2'-phosphotransferase [Pseudomonas]|uniref:RNA 2'-phosphotransferase n=1 Tax=Pseudomonas TaxID=286 RepID=UPI000B352744|nr:MULTISPECIES: RNA 2'-phosphotransferase [Pseudomonas]PMY60825.1 RNA 2'-phosphotransferase [Pseudomonas sp. FW305-25]PMY64139.1 RNA 2'-phosphotransferase [Pseudomonas sp. FW126-L8]PNA75527.1 RNA 2'-phosphotransferase [Pseudomonas sp. FW305-76]
MSKKRLDDTSKFLSYVLRHEPQAIGLLLDSEGWAEVEALIGGAAREGHQLTPELIAEVVASNDKKRFALSEDGQRIRAVQGHSSKTVNLQLAEQQPPAVLYHGTATRFIDSINEKGLIPGSRHHVHLSQDLATAETVGQRYGKVVILKVAAQDMQAQGFTFYQAENGVWLTDHVPVDFLSPL